MTSGQKIAFSLLTALGLFAVFVLSLHSRLFKELETRFYAQAKIEENTGQLDIISESCDSYISEILSLVEKGDNAWSKNSSVRSYYVQNPSESDVNTRRHLTEDLFLKIPALSGIRIVDKNGRNVHYSSFEDTDILKQNGITKIYKNYPDIVKDASEIEFAIISKLSDESKSAILCDQSRGRLIISVPFCWVDGIYSGLCLFYLNIREVENELVSRDIISVGQGMTLFSDDNMNGGIILNLPHNNRSEFKNPTLTYWKSNSKQPEKLLQLPDGRFYVALSSNRIGKLRVSAVFTSDTFEISKEIRVLIYICVFISILLIVFLIFSLFRDPMVTLQKRIKKIQMGIINNYLDGKEKKEWSEVGRQLRLRRKDLSDEIIKSLHVHSKKRREELAEYLDKNWEEIFSIFETKSDDGSSSSRNADLSGASIAELRRMLEEVLQNRNLVVPAVSAASTAAAAPVDVASAPVPRAELSAAPVSPADEVEELDDAEELDEVEEIEEADEVEELAEDVEDAEEVEDLDEAEELEEVEDLDDAEELEDAEEVEELAEDVEDAEELDEAEELEEVEEELEVLDEVEDFDKPPRPADSLGKFAGLLSRTPLDFVPSNETYFDSDKFADVDNLFAEELRIGSEIKIHKALSLEDLFMNTKLIQIKTYKLPEYEDNSDAAVEELTEEVPQTISTSDFVLTNFAETFGAEVPELEAAPSAENVILENNGIYTIADNLEYTNVVQDPEFKQLVNSIL